jgi:microcystin-dependent protein
MEYYIGQIVMFAFGYNGGSYPPTGFLPCDGRLLAINEYQALYALLSITYGGNGNTNFALPDLRGVFPIGAGLNAANTFQANIGQTGGAYEYMPPTTNHLASSGSDVISVPTPGRAIPTTPPYLAVSFAICYSGIYPSNDN